MELTYKIHHYGSAHVATATFAKAKRALHEAYAAKENVEITFRKYSETELWVNITITKGVQ